MKKSKFIHYLLFSLFALIFAFPVEFSAQHNAQPISAMPTLTAAQWQADVRLLGEEMPKRHRNLFHWLKREDFEAAVKQLHDKIPSMSEEETVVGVMKIVAMAKDGHTNLIPTNFFKVGVYPFRFYLYKDGLFVEKAAPEYAEMIGGRVIKIGKLTADEALRMIGQLPGADNEMGIKDAAPRLFTMPEILAGLKIVEDKRKLNLVVEIEGREKSFEIKPIGSFSEFRQLQTTWIDAASRSATPKPLYLKNEDRMYWFEYLKDQKLVYVQQNGVGNQKDETLAAFYKRVFEFVEASPVDKFVLDLRNNGGGDNTLNRPVVIGMIRSKLNERGKMFVIIGRHTFSAAQNFVNEIEKYTNAIFVGEPTAGRPNHYGEGRPLTLPNSKLNVRFSTLWWQDLDPRDIRQWTAPEISVELSSEDYRNNRDPAMQGILDFVPGNTIRDIITEASNQNDIARFIRKYRAIKSDPKNKFANPSSEINRLGYALLRNQKVNEAIEVFKLNVEAYPNSANAYDSLGDAYQAAGNKEEAIKSYEKALLIDPNATAPRDSLRKLKEQ